MTSRLLGLDVWDMNVVRHDFPGLFPRYIPQENISILNTFAFLNNECKKGQKSHRSGSELFVIAHCKKYISHTSTHTIQYSCEIQFLYLRSFYFLHKSPITRFHCGEIWIIIPTPVVMAILCFSTFHLYEKLRLE